MALYVWFLIIAVILVFSAIFIIPGIILITVELKQKNKFVDNSEKIRPGMSKEEVIGLMGDKCSHSYLQDNVEKFEWCYREGGGGVQINNVYTFSESKTRRVIVYLQNDRVIEVHCQNMD